MYFNISYFRFALDTTDFDYVSYKDGKLLTEESNDTNQEEVDDYEEDGNEDGEDDGGDDKEEDTKLEENGDGSENDSGKNLPIMH